MDVEVLRYVVTLSEELHFGRSAARHYVAEGHFGRRIRRLERELGVRLFDRTTRRVSVTPAGARVIAHARTTLASFDSLVEAVRGVEADGQVLRVGVLGFGVAHRWRTLVSGIAAAAPGVRIEYQELDLMDQYDAVRSGDVDVGLVHHLGGLDGLVMQPVLSTPRVAVVPRTSPLADADRLVEADVADLPWLPMAGADPRLAEWAAAGRQGGRTGQVIRRPAAIPTAVATSGRIGLHGAVAVRYCSHPEVAFVPLEGAPVDVAVATGGHDDRPVIRAVRAAAEADAGARGPGITADPIHDPGAACVLG